MIKKLERYIREEDGIKISCPPDNVHIINKINELVDAVNYLQNHIADTSKKVDDRMIGCTTLDIPESYKTDPYADDDIIYKGGDNE